MSTSEALSWYLPARSDSCPFDPPIELRAQGGVRRVRIWDGSSPWVITDYHQARDALSNDLLSIDPTYPGFPEKSPSMAVTMGKERNFRNLDNPAHDIQRRMLAPYFTIKRLEARRPKVQQLVDELIDQMLTREKPVDFVEALALPLPALVICDLLGIPYDDRAYFTEPSARSMSDDSLEDSAAAWDELFDYLARVVKRKLDQPGDDLISHLLNHHRQGDLTVDQVVDLSRLVLVGGHETTANMIALSTLFLLRHPELLAEFRDCTDPARLANGVEELLRILSIAHAGRRRVALDDIEIGGQTIRAGDGVIIANNVADRDPAVFPDPDSFVFDRKEARSHLAFGYGIHQCLGQNLSRIELQVVFPSLFGRLPTLELAIPFGEVNYKTSGSIYGVVDLPLTW